MTPPLENELDGDSPIHHVDRCVELTLETGDVVIYDSKNPSAWIQSDSTVELPSS